MLYILLYFTLMLTFLRKYLMGYCYLKWCNLRLNISSKLLACVSCTRSRVKFRYLSARCTIILFALIFRFLVIFLSFRSCWRNVHWNRKHNFLIHRCHTNTNTADGNTSWELRWTNTTNLGLNQARIKCILHRMKCNFHFIFSFLAWCVGSEYLYTGFWINYYMKKFLHIIWCQIFGWSSKHIYFNLA